MNKVIKTFIVRVVRKDGSIELVPFLTKPKARAFERKAMKDASVSACILQEILN